jgi:hypothetical protein
VTKTRSVTRYRSESRTRQVPRYRSEPRYAEAFAWRAWRWRHQRDIVANGTGIETRWPSDDELRPPAPLAQGEQERFARQESYEIDLALPRRRFPYIAQTLDEYRNVLAQRRWYVDEHTGAVRFVKPVRID